MAEGHDGTENQRTGAPRRGTLGVILVWVGLSPADYAGASASPQHTGAGGGRVEPDPFTLRTFNGVQIRDG